MEPQQADGRTAWVYAYSDPVTKAPKSIAFDAAAMLQIRQEELDDLRTRKAEIDALDLLIQHMEAQFAEDVLRLASADPRPPSRARRSRTAGRRHRHGPRS